jgi:hypothetical protein
MKRGIGLGAVAAVALAIGACSPKPPSCSEPVPPRTIDATTATEAQMQAAHDVVERFIKSSDQYQDCLVAALKEHDKNPSFVSRFYDDGFRTNVEKLLRANQAQKEKVGNGFNEAARTYNTLHP